MIVVVRFDWLLVYFGRRSFVVCLFGDKKRYHTKYYSGKRASGKREQSVGWLPQQARHMKRHIHEDVNYSSKEGVATQARAKKAPLLCPSRELDRGTRKGHELL